MMKTVNGKKKVESEKPEIPTPLVPTTATDNPVLKTVGFMPMDLVRSEGGVAGEPEYVTADLVQRTQRESTHYMVYRRSNSLRANAMMREHGFLGEKIVQQITDPEHPEMVEDLGPRYLIEAEGRSINFVAKQIRQDLTPAQIDKGIADVFGRFHTLEGVDGNSNYCTHNHPHTGNIVYQGGRFGLIDFMLFKTGRVNFQDGGEVYETFKEDYGYLERFVLDNKAYFPQMTDERKQGIYKGILSHYPTTDDVREQVLAKIMGRKLKQTQ